MARLKNSFLAALTIVAGNIIADVSVTTIHLISECTAMLLAVSFANIHNDILDLETDKINRPDRPLPSGRTNLKRAIVASGITAIVSIVLGFSLSFAHGVFFTLLIVFLFIYNKVLKHLPLIKNLTVAALCASPLLLSVIDGKYWNPTLYPPAIFAFLLTLAREIFKDLEDIKGDLQAGIVTFPIAAGVPKANLLAIFITAFTLFFLPLPWLTGTYPPSFLILTGFSVAPLLIGTFFFARKGQFGKAGTLLKTAMLGGLLSAVISMVIHA